MPHAAEYQTAETLGANRGDIPATGTRSYESSNRAGSLPLDLTGDSYFLRSYHTFTNKSW